MYFVKYFIILKIEAYSETINHQMTNIGFLCCIISKRIRLDEAKEWTKGLEIDASGWRLPEQNELETLYQEGMGKGYRTRLLETAAWWFWSAEHGDSFSSSLFDFSNGTKGWNSRTP